MQGFIKRYDLHDKSKCGGTYNFGKYSLPIAFLRDIYDWHLPIEKANNLESISKKGTNYLKKISFK